MSSLRQSSLGQSVRQNWATPASVCLHAAVIVGFLIQFAKPAPSLPADSPTPSLAVEVMLMPTPTPDVVNTAPPPPPPPPPLPEVVEEPPPMIESVAEKAIAAPPPPPPQVKKKPEPQKPVPVKPLAPMPESAPTDANAEPPLFFTPPSSVLAPRANQMALAAPAGRAGPPPNYMSLVSAILQRNKVYPRAAKARNEQGRAHLRFTIDRQGNVLSYELVSSTGNKVLDAEVESLIRRVSPLPPMPPEMTQETLVMNVSVEFSVH